MADGADFSEKVVIQESALNQLAEISEEQQKALKHYYITALTLMVDKRALLDKMLPFLLQFNQIEINAQGNNGSTVLHELIKLNKEVAFFLANGAQPSLEIQDKDGNLPLHAAIKHHFPDLALLFSYGPIKNIAAQDSTG